MRLFVASETQWRRAGMSGVPAGFDYPGVESAARMAAIAVTPEVFADLKIMEAEAVAAMLAMRG